MRLRSLLTSGQINLRLHQIILDMQAADERMLSRIEFDTITTGEMRALAATLLSGDTQFIRTTGETEAQAALVPDWGSWIEGQPLTTAILSNRALLVDLLPLDVDDFMRAYRCTVGQFIAIVKWFVKHGKRIHINLRDLDPDLPATFDKYAGMRDSIGLILQELEDNSLFYCLSARRNIIFSLADGNRPHDRLRLKRIHGEEMVRVAETYPALEAAFRALPGGADEAGADAAMLRGAMVRGGGLIDPSQFAWRLAYYRAYRDIFSEIEESDIDGLIALASPKPTETAELARMVTLFHHRFTAPITGAFGGTYNLRMTEYGPMMADIRSREYGQNVHGLQSHKAYTDGERQIWDWIATEGVRKQGKRLANNVSDRWAFVQRNRIVQDEVVDYILNQAKPVTDEIQAYRDDLVTALRNSLLTRLKKGRDEVVFSPRDYADALESNDASELLTEMEKAVDRANCLSGPVASSMVFGFGMALGIPGTDLKSGAAIFGISADGIGKFLEETIKDPAKSGLSSMISSRLTRTTARMQIVSVLDDISARQPLRAN